MSLNVIASPLQEHPRRLRPDAAPTPTSDWATIAAPAWRKVPGALDQYRESLLARRGARATSRRAARSRRASSSAHDAHRRRRLLRHARRRAPRPATATCRAPCRGRRWPARRGRRRRPTRELGDVPARASCSPQAPEADALRPRALPAASRATSSAPPSTSRRPTRWGQEELARITRRDGARSPSGSSPAPRVKEAIEVLDADPAYQLHGTDALQAWMQGRADEAIAELAGTHFDIPEPVRTHRVHDRARPRRAASTTPARARTSAGPAGCGGRCPRASPSSAPGAS